MILNPENWNLQIILSFIQNVPSWDELCLVGHSELCALGVQSLFSPLDTEVWELENGNNKTIEPTLPNDDYAFGIALFVVEKDFCKKWYSLSSKPVLGRNFNKFIYWFESRYPIRKTKFKNFDNFVSWNKSCSFQRHILKINDLEIELTIQVYFYINNLPFEENQKT